MVKRILETFNRNKELETRGRFWDETTWLIGQSEMSEKNLEDFANNSLGYGTFGGRLAYETHETLFKLAQAIGVAGLQNPENGYQLLPRNKPNIYSHVDDLLDAIEAKLNFGFEITFPKFIGGRSIIKTRRGVVTDRHIHYLYILKRIIELCPDRNSRILEIGAGIGLLGYYLNLAGYKDYTIIDLAYANAIQTYFLWKNLPDRKLILSHDNDFREMDEYIGSIKIYHSTNFDICNGDKIYDLIVNIDGLTEMEGNQAFKYFTSNCAPLFLSINHEVNEFRVCDLDANETHRKRLYRYPFWLREGYVEELYRLV